MYQNYFEPHRKQIDNDIFVDIIVTIDTLWDIFIIYWFLNICVHLSYFLIRRFSVIVIGELKDTDYLRHRKVWVKFESCLKLPGLSLPVLRWAQLSKISWKKAWSEWDLTSCSMDPMRDFNISNSWLLSFFKEVFSQLIIQKGLRN